VTVPSRPHLQNASMAGGTETPKMYQCLRGFVFSEGFVFISISYLATMSGEFRRFCRNSDCNVRKPPTTYQCCRGVVFCGVLCDWFKWYYLFILNKEYQIATMNQYCTYILFSPRFNKYYIGQTHHFKNRISTHNSGKVKSTKHYLPWIKVLTLEKSTRSEAIVLERKLKNLNRERLLEFIDKYKG